MSLVARAAFEQVLLHKWRRLPLARRVTQVRRPPSARLSTPPALLSTPHIWTSCARRHSQLLQAVDTRWRLLFIEAAEGALRLHGETFVCTFLTLHRALSLGFFKLFKTTTLTAFGDPPLSSRDLQLVGLSLGYATALRAAHRLLALLCWGRCDVEVQAFVLRVVDCMLPAARSLTGFTLAEELDFASTIQHALSGAFAYDAMLVAALRSKWTSAAMVQMRRERGLWDLLEESNQILKEDTARWRTDVAEHGLKHCALPSCGKREASVQQ